MICLSATDAYGTKPWPVMQDNPVIREGSTGRRDGRWRAFDRSAARHRASPVERAGVPEKQAKSVVAGLCGGGRLESRHGEAADPQFIVAVVLVGLDQTSPIRRRSLAKVLSMQRTK